MQGDEEEEETDNLVNQVLDEIGINLDEQMVAAPGQKAQVCCRSLALHSDQAECASVPSRSSFKHSEGSPDMPHMLSTHSH